jgi:hypothetical protein
MKDLLNNLNELMAGFSKDAAAQVENGNKAAGARARKASLTIEKALKNSGKYLLKIQRNNYIGRTF